MRSSRVSHRLSLGFRGENAAAKLLKAKGMIILCRNWRCAIGELDIIARDCDEIVAIEVKSRMYSPLAEKHLFDTIATRKQRKLRSLIELYYLQNQSVLGPCVLRIDAVGVLFSRSWLPSPRLIHLRAVC
jgi:putative endonuclease